MSQPPPPPASGMPPTMPPPPGGPVPWPGPQYDAIEAIRYGWTKFTQNLAPFVVLAVITLVVTLVYVGLTDFAFPVAPADVEAAGQAAAVVAGLVLRLVLGLVYTIVMWVLAAATIRGALDVVDTGRTELGQMFTRFDWLQVLLAAVLVTLITMVGTMLCVIPGIIAAFLLMFTSTGVVDGRPALDAMRASFELTKARVADVLLLVLLLVVLGVITLCTCGLGMLVAMPVGTIATAYTWRVLQGRAVAP